MSTEGVKSALRVLDLLELLAAYGRPIGVSEAARRLAAPKSSTQALLTTLLARGYVDRTGTDYTLAPALRGGWAGGPYATLRRVARPVMETLVTRTGESSFLGVLTADGQVQYVDKVTSPQPVRYDADLEPARPAHGTSLGLVMLAFRDEADRERILAGSLPALTPHTIVDRAALREVLETARRDGHAEVVDGHVLGASGVSAPVFDARGRVLAALNLGAPTDRFLRARGNMRDQVLWGAAEITRLLRAGAAEAAHNPPARPRQPARH
jgi:DNA-binding IclR family transcriptional regulator